MSTFDCMASAEMFAAKGRSGLRYRRFTRAAEAIRGAVKWLPPKRISGMSLEVNDECYNATEIRALYESGRSPYATIARDVRSLRACGYMGSMRHDIHAVSAVAFLSPDGRHIERAKSCL